MVLVDTEAILQSPVRFLVSGMGDAMSTYFEARACCRNPTASSLIAPFGAYRPPAMVRWFPGLWGGSAVRGPLQLGLAELSRVLARLYSGVQIERFGSASWAVCCEGPLDRAAAARAAAPAGKT